MLLNLVTCNNHVTICSNEDLLLKVVLFLTANLRGLMGSGCNDIKLERVLLHSSVMSVLQQNLCLASIGSLFWSNGFVRINVCEASPSQK